MSNFLIGLGIAMMFAGGAGLLFGQLFDVKSAIGILTVMVLFGIFSVLAGVNWQEN